MINKYNRIRLGVMLFLIQYSSISCSQDDTVIYPKESTISIKGTYGCFVSTDYFVEIAQTGDRVFLKYENGEEKFQKSIAYYKFKNLWRKLQILKPMDLNNRYFYSESTADFKGVLKFEYTLEDKTVSKEVKLIMNESRKNIEDKQLKKFWDLLINFK